MKQTTITIAVAALLWSGHAMADNYVSGYTRSDGTYVQGHYRSSPNSTRLDNYSTRGNANPYTREKGYRDPYEDGSRFNRGRSSRRDYSSDYDW